MKTAQDILTDFIGKDPKYKIISAIDAVQLMKLYANAKLDEAAEKAECKDISSDNYGGNYSNWEVDKQSILSLKDKL